MIFDIKRFEDYIKVDDFTLAHALYLDSYISFDWCSLYQFSSSLTGVGVHLDI